MGFMMEHVENSIFQEKSVILIFIWNLILEYVIKLH
jgi:hypothetical protein